MASISGLGSAAGDIRANYLNLLIEQLKNQDPTNPMDNSQMTAQLAQLSQLDQMETMNSTFSKVLLSQQASQATSLIGQVVAYQPVGEDKPIVGKVAGVEVENGTVYLCLEGSTTRVELKDIDAVAPVSTSTTTTATK